MTNMRTTRKRSSKSPTNQKIHFESHDDLKSPTISCLKDGQSVIDTSDRRGEQAEEEKAAAAGAAAAAKKEGCQKCGKDNHHNLLLLCEYCNDEYHTYCLDPPLDRVPEGDFFCDKCKSLKVFSKNDNLDAFVAALPPAFTRRFGEIIWAYGGIGFGWWPACIYDPRLTVGGARKLALKNIGKKHLVYFFGCSDTPFTVLPDNKCLAWEEGLLEEHDLGKSAKAMGRARTMMFEWALQAATAENDKPIEYRLDWNHQGEDSCAVSSVVHYGQSSGGGSGGQSGGKGRNTNGKLQGRVLESKKEQGRDSGDTGSHSSSKRDSSGSSIGNRLDSDQITRKQSGHGQDKSVKRIKTAALEPDNDVPSKDASATVNAPSSSSSINAKNEDGEKQPTGSINPKIAAVPENDWSITAIKPNLEPNQTTHVLFMIISQINWERQVIGYLTLPVGDMRTLKDLRIMLNLRLKDRLPSGYWNFEKWGWTVDEGKECEEDLPTRQYQFEQEKKNKKNVYTPFYGDGTTERPYRLIIRSLRCYYSSV